jgi:uncharacterized iron-regulated membrane protein
MVSFTSRPLYPQGKSPWFPLDRRLGGRRAVLDFVKVTELFSPMFFFFLNFVFLAIFVLYACCIEYSNDRSVILSKADGQKSNGGRITFSDTMLIPNFI